MKKTILLASLAFGLMACNSNQEAPKTESKTAETPAKKEIPEPLFAWKATKITGDSHTGEIKLKSGEFTMKDGELQASPFVIDMNSITCTDVKDAEYNKKLVDHLKNKDFFAVEEYPETHIDISNLEKIDETNYKATAVVVIRGVKGEVEIPLSIVDKNEFKMVMGRLNIDRTKYDITYNSTNFFKNLEDKAIDNLFMVKFAIPIK